MASVFVHMVIIIVCIYQFNIYQSYCVQQDRPMTPKNIVSKSLIENSKKNMLTGFIWELSGQFQGDIILRPQNQIQESPEENHWPNGIVYYVIDDGFTGKQLAEILKSMKYIETVSCIKFILNETIDFIHIISDYALGCSSSKGRQGGMQILSLAKPCFEGTKSIIIHELMHAIGFLHEISRQDRDDYVTIRHQNLTSYEMVEFNQSFDKLDVKTFGLPYDYRSVMHYSGETMEKVQILKKTARGPIKTNFGRPEFGMSSMDVLKLNKLYNCTNNSQQ